MVFDYDSWWAMSQRNLPSTSQEYWKLPFDWYRALWQLGIRVDFVSPDATAEDLANYRAVMMPNVYLLSDQQEQQFIDYSINGGSLFVSYFTGISDRSDTVKLGGYGGRLVRETLGVQVSEFAPLNNDVIVQLDSGLKAFEWAQFATARADNASSKFENGVAAGQVAISKTSGTPNWYVGTRLDEESSRQFFSSAMHELGIDRAGGDGVEVIRRGGVRFEIDNINKTVSWR
jgi:beta-galactosidase